ncbi:MAG TPA: EAL domain-containing protein [Burkholderiales bacterium]|nr:EAL domain-containing protein [Burkholderiales bacterium]
MKPSWLAFSAHHALYIGFGAVLLLIVAMTLLGLTRMNATHEEVETALYERHVKVSLVWGMLRNARERGRQIAAALQGGEPVDERYDSLNREFMAAAEALHELSLSPAEREALDRAVAVGEEAASVHADVVALVRRGDIAAAQEVLVSRAVGVQGELQELLERLLEESDRATVRVIARASDSTHSALRIIAGVGLLLFGAGTWIAVAITRRVTRTQSALEVEKELAQVTLHSIGDGVITTGADGCIEYLNPVAERYTGWRTAEARGRPLAEVYRIADESTGQRIDPLASASTPISDPGSNPVSVRLIDRAARECPVRYSHAPIRSRDGRALGMIVVFHDISQIREMAHQLLWQASHDALTGLVNRREFERRLAELIKSARAQSREHVLMYMDLDNFKAVNDTCGHVAGDELLRQLTSVMLTRMRGSDTLARLGGDEFGLLLESCPLDQALRIGNALRETVREFRFVWEDKTFSVGVSVGVVPISAESESSGVLLSRADACCYEAKNKGRDRLQAYRPKSVGNGTPSELHLVSQINHAFEQGRFRLYRQAIAPLKETGGKLPHYEILIRMLDESGNLLPPTAFMPAAERYNLLTSIERWVISSLLEHLHRLSRSGALASPQSGCGYYAVNLSGASVNDKSFPDFLRNLLTRYQLPQGLLCFEITETTAITNLTKAAELMHELKAWGCRFALDDFGTGMSSFAYLKYLPVDGLKIAGMFVRDMAHDPMDYAIVDAINRISHILGMHTVAESVEDAQALAEATKLGIDFAQGYYIAEPEALPVAASGQTTALTA